MTPIYKAVIADGTPIPSVAVNSREQKEMAEALSGIHTKFNELSELINRFKYLVKKDYFMEPEHCDRVKERVHQSLKSLETEHKYFASNYINIGWPDHQVNHTQPIEQCKSKSSTKMS